MDKESEGLQRYMRVRICDNPKCGIHPGATGTLDLYGRSEPPLGGPEVDEWSAIVLIDGHGACGPYRRHEITPMILTEPQRAVYQKISDICFNAGERKDLSTQLEVTQEIAVLVLGELTDDQIRNVDREIKRRGYK